MGDQEALGLKTSGRSRAAGSWPDIPGGQQRGHLFRDLIIRRRSPCSTTRAQRPVHASPGRPSGVAPKALYTHVRGKADLIEGLIDQA
jgi:hypothetical protein